MPDESVRRRKEEIKTPFAEMEKVKRLKQERTYFISSSPVFEKSTKLML